MIKKKNIINLIKSLEKEFYKESSLSTYSKVVDRIIEHLGYKVSG